MVVTEILLALLAAILITLFSLGDVLAACGYAFPSDSSIEEVVEAEILEIALVHYSIHGIESEPKLTIPSCIVSNLS